jgi:hypothetical protein
LQERRDAADASLVLKFVDRKSFRFFLSLFRQPSDRRALLDVAEELVVADEFRELLTEEVVAAAAAEAGEEDVVHVFVDAVIMTYENEEMQR